MSVTLREMSAGYKNLAQLLDETDDPVLVETLLKATTGQIQEKAVNIGKLTSSMDANAEIIKAEIDRLNKRLKSIENKSKWLKEYMIRELEQMKIDRIDDPILPILLINNNPSVEITDKSKLAKYSTTTTTTTITYDKKAIAADLKKGPVPGAELKHSKRIKIG